MQEIWNHVIMAANAFPQDKCMSENEAKEYFAAQTFSGVAEDSHHTILGVYILHPNHVGHCAHIANASYAVREQARGHHIGEGLVRHSMEKARTLGFSILQFNAVLGTNLAAIHLYEKLGFCRLGEIPGGYRIDHQRRENILLYYIDLDKE